MLYSTIEPFTWSDLDSDEDRYDTVFTDRSDDTSIRVGICYREVWICL